MNVSIAPKDDSIFNWEAQFAGAPSADGTFGPHPLLEPIVGVALTPYGYVSSGEDGKLAIKIPLEENQTFFRFAIQFSSYNASLAPSLVFDFGDGFEASSRVALSIVSAGRAEGTFALGRRPQGMALELGPEEYIFAIHELSLESISLLEQAALDAAQQGRPYDIICFPVIDWAYRFQRPQQLLSQFANDGHRAFYLNTRFAGLHVQEAIARYLVDDVFGVSLPGNARLNLYRDEMSENSMVRACDALIELLTNFSCHEAVLLVHLPYWLPLAKEVQRRTGWRIVYDCMDDHSGFENNSDRMLQLEQKTIEASQLLVTTSEVLHQKFGLGHSNALLVRNAGEYKRFCNLPTRRLSPLAELPQPVIGYYGAVAEWFDVEAIRFAATAHPNWSFVIIGEYRGSKAEPLRSMDNVYFTGEIPYHQLTEYVAGFDVCTIPFLRIPLTEATNPVKVYEYLATGKPVVARDLPELEPLANVVQLYQTPQQFVEQLEIAVQTESIEHEAERANLRRQVASENTWESRYDLLRTEVDKLFPKVAIVVVSYESPAYLSECVASVLANTQYPNYELIIVDNASSDTVRRYLIEVSERNSRVKVILNETNRGFSTANNQGLIAAADAEYFILLNNDTVVPLGWLNRLTHYAAKPDIGIVGPVTNSIGNEAQISVAYTHLRDMASFAHCHMRFNRDEFFEIKILAMYCLAMRRQILDEVGYLDEDFAVGMFEDDDYSERVRRAGYRVVCAEDIFVHHYGRASFSKLNDARYREIFEHNRLIYERKWGAWVPHVYRSALT